MSLSGAFDHVVTVSPTAALSTQFDHAIIVPPTAAMSPQFAHAIGAIPGSSLSGQLDHDASVAVFPMSSPFDHFAEAADVPPLVPGGAVARDPSLNLIVVAVNPGSVILGWRDVVLSDLSPDTLVVDTVTHLIAPAHQFPDNIIGGANRTILGYRLHRSDPDPTHPSGGFVPQGQAAGQGNCVADETTLTAGVTQFVDTGLASEVVYAYRLALVIGIGS